MISFKGLMISEIISLLIIFILAPMEHKNKKMNKILIIILLILISLISVTYYLYDKSIKENRRLTNNQETLMAYLYYCRY
jgi:membrane-associated HD superfamily phosphohydrolase